MGTLDTLIFGVRVLAQVGQKLGVVSSVLNFASGATVTYNPATGNVDVFINSQGGGLGYTGVVIANTSLVANFRTGFNSSQFAAGTGPVLTLPTGAVDGTIVGIGDCQGAANTNPAIVISGADGIGVQSPQGDGFVLGDGVHLNQYSFNEPGTWRYWMHVTDPNPGGRGSYWSSIG